MNRRLFLLSAAALAGCAPTVQLAGSPGAGFAGPRLEADVFVSFDGARLGLTRWMTDGEPAVVVVALHGMNDYANAFHFAAPVWAGQGIATYAFDQRGFGRSPQRGVWGGEALMVEDLRVCVSLVRRRHPAAAVVVAGESMGGAVAIAAFASDRPPAADRLVLMAPAVWGWSSQPLPYRTALWFTAHLAGETVLRPPGWVTDRVHPSDNYEELVAMGRDPLMIWGARNDTLYGLVDLMQSAWAGIGRVSVPVGYFYGANDEVIPKKPSFEAAGRLKPTDRTAWYANGYHLLIRDHQRDRVIADVAAFILDPKAPLPSGPPAIPAPPRRGARRAISGL
ncbi:MAG: alpha/beta fold hydrolase [Caulobacter sp.]|nr:alpha/beta fold hydrolase [Caulobacter sp.]